MGQLTVARIKAIHEPGRYTDGDGLILAVKPTGAQSWILRVRVGGQRKDIGLGSTKVLTLAEARAKASDLRRDIARGVDPIAEKKKVVDPSRPSAMPPPAFTLITRPRGRTASIRRNGSARLRPMPSRRSATAQSIRSKAR